MIGVLSAIGIVLAGEQASERVEHRLGSLMNELPGEQPICTGSGRSVHSRRWQVALYCYHHCAMGVRSVRVVTRVASIPFQDFTRFR
ncbi:MAG: hypothetical protein AVDCRST_MAG43-555 [uncultured Thermomicrobiales bacterium]|uniref:Uncharacterized protein n=1 Tax=uncultured Thermomicrobiales bacterium TaxID=1645740 RepID=A0A6J4UAZ4_9BACT|nr:MAG: hypothetical protein AVDCRST_MAG43-555 [uncultured Thermomicrobiales bacterium]